MKHLPAKDRYQQIEYNRCGRSGLKLPLISLGLWHNFGSEDDYANARKLALFAFDKGITHFDLANNYGPLPGSAESNFGKILKEDLASYRDELIISSKAGYTMWEGPYGDWGSKKYMVASLDQSLQRLGVEYLDIFYSHRADPETPIEETVDALEYAVRSGKALYVGLSKYDPEQTRLAYEELGRRGIRCLIHQPRYNMIDRGPEGGLFDCLEALEMGAIVFSPLEQGILGGRYLDGIPSKSRATRGHFLTEERALNWQRLSRALNEIAGERGQSLAQMAIAWVLRKRVVTSALIGASSTEQIAQNVAATEKLSFSEQELARIDQIVTELA
ncbi:aldo/keto reductase [Pelagicoccus mobilis]|uniref:Aldo/keto reductase n=1 Tax=Pelagicoccus mobilis TaxID=415221 RepID=A0A934VK64_9BACT|nr:aldo/keto reductase [Pelagicoccus mobilis]MBK1876336.1 aldo/keto reductase [Pelagicoccus mobilis]